MRWLQGVIGTPRQAHGVGSEDEYRQTAKAFLLRHGLPPVLVERAERPAAYVSCGRWVVDCDCGNGPSASPEWGVAICFECGSIFRPLFPADREEAEQLLLSRPAPAQRNYLPEVALARRYGLARAETARDLRRENRALGIGG